MQTEIIAYLRNIAARCNKIVQNSSDPRVQEAIGEISADLAEKTEDLETTSNLPRGPMPG